MITILIVGDDDKNAEIVERLSVKNQRTVTIYKKGMGAYQWTVEYKPTIVLIHSNVGGIDVITYCKLLRRSESDLGVGIIVLKDETEEKPSWHYLDAGADDVVLKTDSIDIHEARIKALYRRMLLTPIETELVSGNLRVDMLMRKVYVSDVEVKVRPRAFNLLVFLMRNKGRVYTSKALLTHVWGIALNPVPKNVSYNVYFLRKAIEEDSENPTRVLYYNRGYVFVK